MGHAPNTTKNGNIDFNQGIIPQVNVYYADFSFVIEYRHFFIRIRPFIIYNNTYYGMRQILTFIRNQFPNVTYRRLADKMAHSIHYGYNLTNLPPIIANRIDFLGFRLIDYNFPLRWFELQQVFFLDEVHGETVNHTLIKIPRANLVFSFKDLYPYGYSVQHVNSTYVLIGNVNNRTDLYVDPLVLSSDTIYLEGYSQSNPCNFTDLYNGDKAGTLELLPSNTYTSDQYVNLTTQPRCSDELSLRISINVTAESSTSHDLRLFGKDKDGNNQTEDLENLPLGITNSTLYYSSIDVNGIQINVAGGSPSITFYIFQNQWGVVWRMGTDQFRFDCLLYNGNGTHHSYFADTNKQVTFAYVPYASVNLIEMDNATLRFGTLIDETQKTTKDGVRMFVNGSYIARIYYHSNSTIELYSSSINTIGSNNDLRLFGIGNPTGIFYESELQCFIDFIPLTGSITADFNRVNIHGLPSYAFHQVRTAEINDVFIHDVGASAIYLQSSFNYSIRNLKIRNVTRLVQCVLISTHKYLINIDSDNWVFLWSATNTAYVFRQYEFDLTTYFPNGTQIKNANVTISNAYTGTSDSWLTFSNGSIPMQTLSYGFYLQAGQSKLQDVNPYNLTVTLNDYETYTDLINITKKENLRISLTPAIEGDGLGEGLVLGMFIVGILSFVCFLIFRKGQ